MFIRDLSKQLEELDMSSRALRHFGLLFSVFFCLWGVVLVKNGHPLWLLPAGGALASVAAAFFLTPALRRPYQLWMLLAYAMGWLMTKVLLTSAFVIIMTPIGVLLRMLGKDVLDERIERDVPTYWKINDTVGDVKQSRKQF